MSFSESTRSSGATDDEAYADDPYEIELREAYIEGATMDMAFQVVGWVDTIAGAIVAITHDPDEECRPGRWRALEHHVAEQQRLILRALLESVDVMNWASHDPEVVGAALREVVAAARQEAVRFGWEPRRRPIPSRTRTLVYRRDGYACVECGDDDVTKLTVDHRIPVDLGGDNSSDNLRTLCRGCNSIKGASL